MSRAVELAAFLATEGRPLILERFRRDSCIVSTRIALEVARAAGIGARRREVIVVAANAPAVPLIKAGVPAAEWPDEAHSVGCVQAPTVDGGWPGAHLVAVFDDGDALELMLDLSADQFDRPAKNLHVPHPIIAPWVRGSDQTAVRDDNGAEIGYVAVERPTPLTSRDWTDERRRRPIVAELIRSGRRRGLVA